MKLVLATRNQGKIHEMKALLVGLGIQILTVADFPDAQEVVEDRPTLEGNALKKAQYLHELTGLPSLADDTGLEVDALDGRPGVYSARFAGPEADPVANRALLKQQLDGVQNRKACFRTVLSYVSDQGSSFFEGECCGVIIQEERGTGGFGYDALFVPEGYQRTFAELPSDEKNLISHRGRALRIFLEYMKGRDS